MNKCLLAFKETPRVNMICLYIAKWNYSSTTNSYKIYKTFCKIYNSKYKCDSKKLVKHVLYIYIY